MSDTRPVEIHCGACEEDALLLRTPVYEGFTKTGEALSCAACGHVYDSEDEVPFKERKGPALFTEADRPQDPEVFTEEESGKLCRYCINYVVNPFTQWCGEHHREVEATDSCDQFERKPKPEEDTPI